MKTGLSAFVLSFMILASCDFRKSANVDFLTGLNTRGDGLSCEEVYLSDGENRLNRSSFTYGESFYLNFRNIDGFAKQEGYAFPGLRLTVLDQSGDAVLIKDDLYADHSDGFNFSPLLLQAFLTVADPIHSNREYTLNVNIWDKKGRGTFKAKMEFSVIPDQKIRIESGNVTWDEIYLFSGASKTTITGDQAKFNEDLYLLFEGLEGFRQESGMVYFGLGMKITDNAGTVFLNEADLAGDEGMDESDFRSQVAPSFVISNTDVKNPVTCEVVIWDKKSDRRIKAGVKINME